MLYHMSYFSVVCLLSIGISTLQVSANSPILEAVERLQTGEKLLPHGELLHSNIDTPAAHVSSLSQHEELSKDSSLLRWNPNAADFPNVWTAKDRCNRPGGNYYDNWICDPDGILTLDETNQLNDKINNILGCKKCACDKSQCRDSPAPYGKYSIGVALLKNFTGGTGTPDQMIQEFTTTLRSSQWRNIQRCEDGVFLALNIGDRTYFTSTGSRANEELSEKNIEDIDKKVLEYLEREEWFNYFNEKLDLIGDELPGSCGLSGGQIAGIVIGCILGVILIVALIVLCIGFFQNWDCVVGTCAGVCMGFLLGAIQACINAMIFQCVKNMCNAMGCGDCNPCEGCEPLSCVDEMENGGVGGEF